MVEFILLQQLAYKLCIFLFKKIFFKEALSILVEKTLATYVQLAMANVCLAQVFFIYGCLQGHA